MAADDNNFGEQCERQWDNVCDFVENNGGPTGAWISNNVLRRLTIEAPVVVGFCFICVLIHILDGTICSGLSFALGVNDWFSAFSPVQYLRLLSHIFAHSSYGHIRGNMVNLLLVGPSAEHVFGSMNMLLIMFLVAITSAIAHIVVGGKHTRQLGASGVVFALILLNSLVSASVGKVPVSFILTAGLWLGDEVYRFFFGTDGNSHHAHLTGALVGTLAGFELHRRQQKAALRKVTSIWRKKSK